MILMIKCRHIVIHVIPSFESISGDPAPISQKKLKKFNLKSWELTLTNGPL